MRSSSLRVAIAAVVIALAIPATALAAPVPFDTVDVAVLTDVTEPVMLVSGTLSQDTPLPAEVRLTAPAGSELHWAGEILGGDPAQDPSHKPSVETRDGLDIYTFTVTKSHVARVEVAPAGLITTAAEGMHSNLSWTPLEDVRQVNLNFLLPQTSRVLTPAEGATMEAGPEGYSYYTRKIENAKAGEPLTLAFDYTPGTAPASGGSAPASQAASSQSSNGLVLAIVFGIAAAGLLWVGNGFARKARAKAEANAPAAPVARSTAKKTVRQTQAVANDDAEESSADVETDEFDDDQPAEGSRTAVRKPVYILTGVVLLVGVIAGIALGTGGKAAISGDVATLQIAQVDTCSSVNIPMTVPAGGDLTRDANDILGRLKSVTGVGHASIYLKESRIEVAFCDSNSSEAAIRAALAPSGYVSAEVPQQPSAEATVAP